MRFLDLLEEIITFVIYQNKGREIFHFDFPDRFHTQFRIFHALQTLDALLCQHRRRATNAAKIESAVFMTGIRHLLAAVAFRQHDHAPAVGLQLIHIGIHAPCCGRAK
ncbi:hypothetical protein D3C87_1917650 [compost metagenome]